MPLNLGGILFSEAIFRPATGTLGPELGERFRRAGHAAVLLITVLRDLALAGGLSEEIARSFCAESVLCAAAAGEVDVVAAYDALPPAPGASFGEARRGAIGERLLVELVNASHYDLAKRSCESLESDSKPWADPVVAVERSMFQRDALFSLAVFGLHCDGSLLIERSRDRFGLVARIIEQSEVETASDLMTDSHIGEINARDRLGDHVPASALRESLSRRVGG
jgi:hypothetical protein